jgi:hypothetical protein
VKKQTSSHKMSHLQATAQDLILKTRMMGRITHEHL